MSNLDELTEILQSLKINPSTDSNQTSLNNSLNSNSTLNSNLTQILTVNMAELKPEFLNCVPTFNGNPSELNRFLSVCDSLIQTFYDVNNPANFRNTYLLNSLISKLEGNAKVIINIQGCKTWLEVRNALQNNFGDQRDETCLNRDLVMMRQFPQEKPQHFYERILNILNLLVNYIDSHEETNESKQLKRTLYNNLALKTFLSGLKEPLGTTIRCMRPTTLSEANQLVIQESNFQYLQKPNHRFQSFPQNNRSFSPSLVNRPMNSNFQSNIAPNRNFPSQPINVQPIRNVPQNFPSNSQVFRNQQKSNVFRPNRNNSRQPNPTPMSVSTRNTGRFFNNSQPGPSYSNTYFRPTGPKNYESEELFNLQTEDENETHFEENDKYYHHNDEENFSEQPLPFNET